MNKKPSMRFIFLLLLSGSSFLVLFSSCSTTGEDAKNNFPVITGPYLGQTPPDTVPELFAPGIIGTGMFTRDIAIPPSGEEVYYCVSIGNYAYSTILYTKQEKNRWTQPNVVPFAANGKVFDIEPAFSPDGERLYFHSARPSINEGAAGQQEQNGMKEPGEEDIWYVDRSDQGWGEPVNPGAPLNSDGGEFFPSVTRDSFLYFTHNKKGSGLSKIYRSRIYADSFGTPELLPPEVNCGTNRFNAFVATDHSYVIVPAFGMADAYDRVDYYVTFRNTDDQWSRPMNLGSAVNEYNTRGWSPFVTPDGKYFFFMANWSEEVPAAALTWDKLRELHVSPRNGNADIYWMKADFITSLRTRAVFDQPQ